MTAAVLGFWTGVLILIAALIGLFTALLQRNLEHKIGDFARRPLGVSWNLWLVTSFTAGAGLCVLTKQSPAITSGLLIAAYFSRCIAFQFNKEPPSRSDITMLSVDTFMFALFLVLVWILSLLHLMGRMLDLMKVPR